MKESGSGKGSGKVANGLVAMSCAGVLAVYAAGYVRTRSAADQLDAQSVERRVAQETPRPESGEPEGRPAETPPVERAAAETPPPAIQPSSPPPEPRVVASVEPVQPSANPSSTPSAPPAPLVEEPAPSSITAPPPVMAAPAVQTPVIAAPVPEPKVVAFVAPAPAPAPAPVAPPPAQAPPPAPKWKDGTYYGWGTSRHGDIQAEVVIAGGRIAAATISQCRTRYPCSVIDRLPPEVAQRQSPEVDYISRATQSTNAFYYAVVEALGKAK